MSAHENVSRMMESGIVAVIRADSGELLADVAEALVAGGVDVMEVTFTVPNAVQVIQEVNRRIGDKILLGAGTVLDTETARAAILAGAEFIVSPSTDVKSLSYCVMTRSTWGSLLHRSGDCLEAGRTSSRFSC